jgi:hypothetical protein
MANAPGRIEVVADGFPEVLSKSRSLADRRGRLGRRFELRYSTAEALQGPLAGFQRRPREV